jgi:cobalt-zinc-cadmium efflux system membrane fusion protein
MKRSSILILILAFAAALAGCGDKAGETKPAAAASVDPNVIVADETLAGRLKVGTIGEAQVSEELRVPGSVGLDERRVARIGSSVTGRITQVLVFRGDEVKTGQTLATLNSTELANGQMQFLTAIADVDLKSRAVDRAKQLLAADVIGSAELQRRENELFSAQVAMKAARDQLRLMGMSSRSIDAIARSREINSVATVSATMSGTVIDRQINQGQVVQPADAVYTVADLGHVWIEGEVPEQQAYLVEMGEDVRIELPALPGRQVTGKIIYISSTVNPETRTVQVRTDVLNADRAIKPDMLANLLIRGVPQKKLVVPITAVVRESNRDHVFARTGDNQFRLVPVTLGQESGKVVVVKDGLKDGDAIVIDGAFHLNNERKRKILG